MKTIKTILITACLICLSVSSAWCDELLSFKVGYQHLTPDGSIAAEDDSLPETSHINLADDLDLEDSDEFTLEAALQIGDLRFSAAYLPLSFSGKSLLTKDINFNGETFVANSHIKSQIDLDIYEAGIAWHIINIDDLPTRIQFGPELALKYIDAAIALEDTLLDSSVSASIKTPVPTVGLRGRIAIADSLGIAARAGYLEYNDSSFFDVDLQLEYSPLPMVGVFAGYRYLDIDLEEDDVTLDASFDGPYLGALVRF